jgi:hypothetical protein
VGQKFAEKHGACPSTATEVGTTPNLGVKQKRLVKMDESCVFTQDHTDTRHAGNPKKEKVQQSLSFLMVTGGAWTSYVDEMLAKAKNDKGQALFSQEQINEYLDMMHVAFLASIEKLASVESEDAELEEDEKILARKFYNCREERDVTGISEDEFVKRVFGK